jgi:TPR repeat protein
LFREIRLRNRFLQQFNMPIYVPAEGRGALNYLETRGTQGLVEELEKLCALGSRWACATLASVCLAADSNGERNVTRALDLCRDPAASGDAYALYVYAWALLYSGSRVAAMRAIRKSALGRFPPAVLDSATFAWNGWGLKERSPRVALGLVYRSFAVHHALALWWLSALFRSGQYGIVLRLLGYLLTPFGALWYLIVATLTPFSSRVFSLSSRSKHTYR